MRTEHDAAGQEQPRNHGPAAGNLNPLLAWITHDQSAQCESKRNRESHISEVQHWRMDHHFRILQKWVQSIAIHCNLVHNAEWVTRKVDQQEEEDLDAGKHHRDRKSTRLN